MSAHSFIYLGSKKYGEGRMGLTATPIYNITKDTNVPELEDTMHSDNRMMRGFFLRSKGYDSAEGLSTLKWQNISSCYDSANAFVCGTRKNGIAYWSPDVAGFSSSVGYFEDDEWVRHCAIRWTTSAREFTSDAEPGGRPRGRPLSSRWPEGAKSGACPARALRRRNSIVENSTCCLACHEIFIAQLVV